MLLACEAVGCLGTWEVLTALVACRASQVWAASLKVTLAYMVSSTGSKDSAARVNSFYSVDSRVLVSVLRATLLKPMGFTICMFVCV